MKFSIIIPVYNVEDYLEKCLLSLKKQTYNNFEVIIVNDGTQDNCQKIIDDFCKKNEKFKGYIKQNGGLSSARNYGLKYVTGDYILFIDSDDYVEEELLERLNKSLEKNKVDVLKYNLRFIYEKENTREMNKKHEFVSLHPNKAIEKLLEDEILEPAWLNCYKTSFWKKNKFKYYEGRVHEDFGLTPLIYMNAKTISSINYVGYNYLIREGSIINSKESEKMYKKFNDCLSFYDENIKKIKNNKNINTKTKKMLNSYYVNGILEKASLLDGKYIKSAIEELKRRKVYRYLISNSFLRILKKVYIKYFLKSYIWSLKNEKN